MFVTIKKLGRLSFRKVYYYTVFIEDADYTEFEDFLIRMKSVSEYGEQLGKILQFIQDIGEKYGARSEHFRHERSADALPPRYYIQPGKPNKYGIRLYCIRLSNEIVVLLNGDLKTEDNPEDCPNCRRHFRFANAVARKLNDAIRDGEIVLNDKHLDMDDDFEIAL